jgi:hypothetical protein
MVPTVEVPIKQLISAEPSLCSAFRKLVTGMGKMIHNDLGSMGTAANNARTARSAASALSHQCTNAGMIC